MANIKAISKRTRTVPVDLGDGDNLTVEYRPSAYTPEFEMKAQGSIDAKDRDALGKMLVDILIDWDLFEDEAQKVKVPITVERLRTLPMIVLAPVLEAIGGDLSPNRKSAVASGAGSMEP
jgi:hypothetical protein